MMAKQSNKYIVKMSDGTDIMICGSNLKEVSKKARKMEEAMTVQRVFKNATRICQNVRGKAHSV